MADIPESPSIDRFIDLFLAALVLRGKDAIWIRTEPAANQERRRMHALYEYLNRAVDSYKETPKESIEKDYLYFLVRLRNHVAPSVIGSFDDLQHSILGKMSTIISVDLATCWYYRIDLQKVTAKGWLERAPDRIRTLAEEAADEYMKPLNERVA